MSIVDFTAANTAINNWLMSGNAGGLSEEVQAKITPVLATPVMPERVSQFAEVIYANQDDCSASAPSLAADLCDFATGLGFYGLGEDQRGTKISAILRGTEVSEPPLPKSQHVASGPAGEVPPPAETAAAG